MSGLKRICKQFGGMTVVGPTGKRIEYVWDYAADKAVIDYRGRNDKTRVLRQIR